MIPHDRPAELSPAISDALRALQRTFAGELHLGDTMRRIYATDASEYQEYPLAVACPATEEDVRALVRFASEQRVGLIPRGAGTSLAGQVVGAGIVVDLGRHLREIIAIDPNERRVRVQPGVIRNELNDALRPYGLLFGPETSTANRAMIGGMVGNNSCGSNSLIYGSTREHLIKARGFLSDGSEVVFGPLTPGQFAAKCEGADTLERRIYRRVRSMLGNPANQKLIRDHFPQASVTRRNTGYALDRLMDARVFDPESAQPFNLCQLIAGSEGTLFIGVEFELTCDPLPPPHAALLCGHFLTVDEALRANLFAVAHRPSASELIDRHILECTKQNLAQSQNRAFVQGDPGAILVVEIRRESRGEAETEVAALEREWRAAGLGYAFPVLWGADGNKVWELRRAGQGVMTNVVGDAKPREVVEDTAVDVRDLPSYIAEFDALMRDKYGISCVYYAHAGAGELHTRPLFNLKTEEGRRMFRQIATDVADLVKRYRGSLSGEHGDGRLRGEFIPRMVGEECFALMRDIKATFDPNNLLNPGKIIDTPPMDTGFRHGPGEETPDYETTYDFSDVLGVVRAAEKCNGSGDCRKLAASGGTMCPSYMATLDEKNTPRARANIVRQMLNAPANAANPFDNPEIAEAMEYCLSCKACKSECPSSVDIARLKAEWLHQRHRTRGVPLRSRLIAASAVTMGWASALPGLWNAVAGTAWTRRLLNRVSGFHPERTLPLLPGYTLRRWFAAHRPPSQAGRNGTLHLFGDEFTNLQDAEVGVAAIELLEALGYRVLWPEHAESGRASLSKGLLDRARSCAESNVALFAPIVTAETPLVGIEPSALLSFRDEYPDLLRGTRQKEARQLARHCLLFDEFIAREADAGRIRPDAFVDAVREVRLHGHCFQKSLASLQPSVRMLQLPRGYRVEVIPSGCCGMAGAFGFEKEHFEVSQKVGELVLLPTVRALPSDTIVAAAGTSCRHQIHDGTGRKALHPAQILRAALKS